MSTPQKAASPTAAGGGEQSPSGLRFDPPQLAAARTSAGMAAAAANRRAREESNTPPPQSPPPAPLSSNSNTSNGPSSPTMGQQQQQQQAVRFAPASAISTEKLAAMRAEVREIFQRGDEDTADAIDAICESNGWTRDEFIQNRHTFQHLEIFLALFPTVPFIRYFPNVVHLRIMHCGLKEIDAETLKALTGLETLWLAENELSTVRGGGLGKCCPRLRELYVHNNNFTSIEPFLHLPSLEVLVVSRNRITSLDGLSTLPSLRSLYAAGNGISRIRGAIESNTALEELNLSGNKIASFREIPCLNALPKLAKLFFADPTYGDNPVTLMSNYQTFTLCHVKSLIYLDFIIISPEQRAVAEATYAKKRVFYAMRLQSMERALDTLTDEAFKLAHSPLKEAESSIVRLTLALGEWEAELHRSEAYQHYALNIPADRARMRDTVLATVAQLRRAIALRRAEALRYRRALAIVSSDMALAQRRVTSRMLLELDTGGNVRLEDGRPKDVWFQSCSELLRNRFVAGDFAHLGLGINSVNVSRVTRIHNTALRTQFDRELVRSVDIADPSYKRLIEYLFFALPVQGCSEVASEADTAAEVVEHGFRPYVGGLGYVPLTNSLYLAEQIRLMEISRAVKGGGSNSNGNASTSSPPSSPTAPASSASASASNGTAAAPTVGTASADNVRNMPVGRVIVVKVFLYRQGVERGLIPMRYDVPLLRARPLDRGAYGVDSLCIPRARSDDPKQRIWYLFDDAFALPEYIIDYTYGTAMPATGAGCGGSASASGSEHPSSSAGAAATTGIITPAHQRALAAIPRPAIAEWPTARNEEMATQLRAAFPNAAHSDIVDMKSMAPHWLSYRDALEATTASVTAAGASSATAAAAAMNASGSSSAAAGPIAFSFPTAGGAASSTDAMTLWELTQKARVATTAAFEALPTNRNPKMRLTEPSSQSASPDGNEGRTVGGTRLATAASAASFHHAPLDGHGTTTDGNANTSTSTSTAVGQPANNNDSNSSRNAHAVAANPNSNANAHHQGASSSAGTATGGASLALTAEHVAAQVALWGGASQQQKQKQPFSSASAASSSSSDQQQQPHPFRLTFAGSKLSGIALSVSFGSDLAARLAAVTLVDLRSNALSMRLSEWAALSGAALPNLEVLLLGDNRVASLPSAAALAPMMLYSSPTRGARALQLSGAASSASAGNNNNGAGADSIPIPTFPSVQTLDLSKNAFVDVTGLEPLRRMFPALVALDVTSNVGGLGGVGAALTTFAASAASGASNAAHSAATVPSVSVSGAAAAAAGGSSSSANAYPYPLQPPVTGGIQCAEASVNWLNFILFVAAPPSLRTFNGRPVEEAYGDAAAPPNAVVLPALSSPSASPPPAPEGSVVSCCGGEWAARCEVPLQLTIPLTAHTARGVARLIANGLYPFGPSGVSPALSTNTNANAKQHSSTSGSTATAAAANASSGGVPSSSSVLCNTPITTESGAIDPLSMKRLFAIAMRSSIAASAASPTPFLFPSFANTKRTANLVPYDSNPFDADASAEDKETVRTLRYLSLCGTLSDRFPTALLAAAASHLTFLELEGHQFSEIDAAAIRGLVNAESISLRHNKIRTIPSNSFSHLTKLARLDMGFNQLRDVGDLFTTGTKCAALQCAVFDNNFLKTVAPFSLLDGLQALYASNNLIATEKDINLLRDVEKLIILDLSGNPCSSGGGGGSSSSSFAPNNAYRPYVIFHLRRLRVLDGVPIDAAEVIAARDVFAGRVSAELLNERIAPATNWAGVTELNLSSCGLKEVMLLEDFTQLKHLRLEHNLLTAVDGLRCCRGLISLNLADNRIGDHPVGPTALNFITSLESLSLEANGVTSLAALGLDLPRLKFLNLKANGLLQLDGTERLPGVRELILDANRLRVLPREALLPMAAMRDLRCSNNAIKALEGAVGALRYLTNATFEANRLGDIQDILRAFEGSPLVSLSLLGNAVVRKPLYRNGLIHAMQCLKQLDGKPVTMEERERVELTYLSAPPLMAGGGYFQQPAGGASPPPEGGGGGAMIGGIPVSGGGVSGGGALMIGGQQIQPTTHHSHANNQAQRISLGEAPQVGGMMIVGNSAPTNNNHFHQQPPPTSAPAAYQRGSGLLTSNAPAGAAAGGGLRSNAIGGGRSGAAQPLAPGVAPPPRTSSATDPRLRGVDTSSAVLASNPIRVAAPSMGAAGRLRKA